MAQLNNGAEAEYVINAANTIAQYCRTHICTECPLNLTPRHESIMKAHCVCDFNVLHLPSTWQVETLIERRRNNVKF